MRITRTLAALAAVAALAVAGCSSAAQSSSQAQAAPSSPPANVLVCEKLVGQITWAKDNAAGGTLADAMKVDGWLRQDASNATGRLRLDVHALARGFENTISTGSTADEASALQSVAGDCAALGVSV